MATVERERRIEGDAVFASITGPWGPFLGIGTLVEGREHGYPLCCVVAFWADGALPSAVVRGRVVEVDDAGHWLIYVPCPECASG